jgi:hypothetical protein
MFALPDSAKIPVIPEPCLPALNKIILFVVKDTYIVTFNFFANAITSSPALCGSIAPMTPGRGRSKDRNDITSIDNYSRKDNKTRARCDYRRSFSCKYVDSFVNTGFTPRMKPK